jgi:hypothetical protein
MKPGGISTFYDRKPILQGDFMAAMEHLRKGIRFRAREARRRSGSRIALLAKLVQFWYTCAGFASQIERWCYDEKESGEYRYHCFDPLPVGHSVQYMNQFNT